MKKLFTFLLFISICKMGFGQTFAPGGSFWRYCYTQWEATPGNAPGLTSFTSTITIGQAEIIQGKPIVNLLENIGGTDYVYKFHVSGDTTFTFSQSDNSFTPLYNFSYQVGDTMHLNGKNSIRVYNFQNQQDNEYARYVIDSVGTVNIQGVLYRYYNMKYDNASSPNFFQSASEQQQTFRITEKMGLNGFILPVFYGGNWDGPNANLIYYRNSTVDNFYGSSQSVCNLALEDEQAWAGNIFPNPVDKTLYVTSSYNEDRLASITDMQGRVLKRNILISSLSTISVSLTELSAGIYILSIPTGNGNFVTQKIIKN